MDTNFIHLFASIRGYLSSSFASTDESSLVLERTADQGHNERRVKHNDDCSDSKNWKSRKRFGGS